MRFISHIRIKALALALFAVLVLAGVGASAATRDVKPFVYSFRVTSITVTGTFTVGDATTTTRTHLSTPTKKVYMTWRGKRDGGMHNGVGATAVVFVGDATYKTVANPSCTRTMNITSSGSQPTVGLVLGGARDRVVTHPSVFVRVGKFPFVTGYPARDGVCGKVAKDWWDVASHIYPFRILKQNGFTLRSHYKEAFDDGEAMEWTLQMTVRRVRFQPMSCQVAKGC